VATTSAVDCSLFSEYLELLTYSRLFSIPRIKLCTTRSQWCGDNDDNVAQHPLQRITVYNGTSNSELLPADSELGTAMRETAITDNMEASVIIRRDVSYTLRLRSSNAFISVYFIWQHDSTSSRFIVRSVASFYLRRQLRQIYTWLLSFCHRFASC